MNPKKATGVMDVDERVSRAPSAVLLAIALVVAGAAMPAAGPAAAVAATPAAAPPVRGTLLGVAGTSAHDVWAVGFRPSGTLTEHWNGVRWRVVPSPSPGTGKAAFSVLSGVAAVSRADAWAVGSYSSGPDPLTATTHALIEHWNGQRWTRVPCPCSHSEDGVPSLAGIAAVSRTDIWAVGSGVSSPLILRWNGTKWTTQSLAGNGEDELTAVSATSAHNAWAVGNDVANGHSLIAHWDGTKWSLVRNPNPGHFNVLNAVTAISRTDAWAVGQDFRKEVKIEHWNGGFWSLKPNPHITGILTVFNGVTAAPNGSVWAVGKRTVTKSLLDKTLTARWTGTRWINVRSPDFGSSVTADNRLYGVYAPSARSAWAVGGFSDLYAVIEHWNGRKWHLIAP